MWQKLTIFFLASSLAFPSLAQEDKYRFSRLDISQGLSRFGTMSGLNRWDGYTFKTFRHCDARFNLDLVNHKLNLTGCGMLFGGDYFSQVGKWSASFTFKVKP